jgi:hypothetical protein
VNRRQWIALGIAAANLAILLLFPPYDQYSIASSRIPVFAGFNFAFSPPSQGMVNSGVLTLEVIVLLVNAAVAWLLLRDKRPEARPRRGATLQNAVLVITAVNLIVMLLFPPFESVFAVTNAALPNFEGFYFIFSQKPSHTIVTTILYIEVIFVLVNGCLFWLVFKERRPGGLTAAQVNALSARLKR